MTSSYAISCNSPRSFSSKKKKNKKNSDFYGIKKTSLIKYALLDKYIISNILAGK